MPRARKADVAACQMGEPVVVDEEEAVRARIASGELVPHPKGDTPVRDHIVAQLRARMSAPRPPLAKKAAGG